MNRPTGENLHLENNHDFIPGANIFFKVDNNVAAKEYVPCEGLPSNPQDYLRSVMLEAQNCPDVVVAAIKPEVIKKTPRTGMFLPTCIPGSQHAPSNEWCIDRLRRFNKAREEHIRHLGHLKSIKRQTKKRPKLPIYPLPAWNDEENWRYLCLGNQLKPIQKDSASSDDDLDADIGSPDEEQSKDVDDVVMEAMAACGTSNAPDNENEAEDEGRSVELSSLEIGFPPMLRILLRMEPKQIQANLEYHAHWLKTYGFSNHQGRWIYALLTCLEKPLYPSVISMLRDLSRQSAQLRANMDSHCSEINGLNLIICIVGRYFDQTDLRDEVHEPSSTNKS